MKSQDRKQETAIDAYLVSDDGIDQCHVSFLQRHLVAHSMSFDGVLVYVIEVYSALQRENHVSTICVAF